MFGIPEWALGVGFIILVGSVVRVLVGRFVPSGEWRGGSVGRQASRREMAATVEEMKGKQGGVEEIEGRLSELDDLQRRLADVEERLDFAERMLSQQKDAQRLGPSQRQG